MLLLLVVWAFGRAHTAALASCCPTSPSPSCPRRSAAQLPSPPSPSPIFKKRFEGGLIREVLGLLQPGLGLTLWSSRTHQGHTDKVNSRGG